MDSQDYQEGGNDDPVPLSDTQLLRQAWMNERSAPEIQPYQGDLVERTLESVCKQEEMVEGMMQEQEGPAVELAATVYRRELARVKFLLRSYLRTRVQKIEAHVLHILNHGNLYSRLSEAEQEFAKGFTDILQAHFEGAVLSRLPQEFGGLLRSSSAQNNDDMIPEPNLDGHVFCRVLENVGNMELAEDEAVELTAGDIFLLRYRPVRALLEPDTDTGLRSIELI